MDGSLTKRWEDELERWLEPFLQRLRRQAQRRWAPVYLKGLILPGERKSVEPMAARVAPADTQQLHHFVSSSPWATAPLEDELVKAAGRLVGGPDAALVVDDTALVKQGRHSVGVKRQYCGQLGKKANCQSLVSLTLARAGVPVGVGLRLFLPEDWSADAARRAAAGVPETVAARPRWRIGLDEIDRVLAAGARFGAVLADAEYGKAAEFRHGLAERGLAYAVGILPTQKVYPADVTLSFPGRKGTGRPRKHPVPSAASVAAAELVESRPEAFRAVSWRAGTKGPLKAEFAALRVGVADGPADAGGRHLPGDEAWLVGEHRATGERKYYLSNLPPDATLERLAGLSKARGGWEELHQQLKDELGLDHFEGRSWRGLHHHALLCLLALAFLQHLRLRGKKRRAPPPAPHPPPAAAAPPPAPAPRPGRACPPSGGASWRRSPGSCCAARTAGRTSSTTSGSEGGRVVLMAVAPPIRLLGGVRPVGGRGRRSEGSPLQGADQRATTLYPVGPRPGRTMMQPCASAAGLRGGGPPLNPGAGALVGDGLPPPRIVIGSPPRTRGPAPKLFARLLLPGGGSPGRAKDDALGRLAGGHQPPQRDEQLPRQRHDHGLARAAAGVRGPRPVPAGEVTVSLEAQEAPGELEHAAAHAGVAHPRQALLPPPGPALVG